MAAGQGYSAMLASSQAKGAAAQAEVNRAEANRSAADAIARGDEEQKRHYRQVSAQMGEQRAALAANGLDVNFGNAGDVVADTALYGQEDANTIAQNTMRESRGFEIEAANFGAEAKSQRKAAKGALIKGAFDIGSTILGGASQYGKLTAGRAATSASTSSFGGTFGNPRPRMR